MSNDIQKSDIDNRIAELEERVHRMTRVVTALVIMMAVLVVGLFVPEVLDVVRVVLLIGVILIATLSVIGAIRLALEFFSPIQDHETDASKHSPNASRSH